MNTYAEFLQTKRHSRNEYGFAPSSLPSWLFDFQAALVDNALRLGRSAIFADCGLGKTPMQLAWADAVVRRTAKPVLLLSPLAVSFQTMREAEKFGVESERCQDGQHSGARVVVTNYQRLEAFDPSKFSGVVLDESSILKSFDGITRKLITEFMRKVQYRLLCTATAAPNDYTELGTSSEALGLLGHMDMLAKFFKNDLNTSDQSPKWRSQGGRAPGQTWRFKGHAEIPFWRWVCSWARTIRKPSDLGFDDGRFVLPLLSESVTTVSAATLAPGALFAMPAVGLAEQREERRRTIRERCESLAQSVHGHDRSLVWCHLNDEGDLLSEMIPDSAQVSGNDSDDKKEEVFRAFADGQIPRLITKAKIAAWGLNFQQCAHIATFPSHSFEQHYQGVRRCWRFGQSRPVSVDIIATESEIPVVDNLRRKAAAADKMFERLVDQMKNAMTVSERVFAQKEEIPSWL